MPTLHPSLHSRTVTHEQISWCIACSNSLLLRMARTLPLLLLAQKGEVTSTLDSQTSDLGVCYELFRWHSKLIEYRLWVVLFWSPWELCLSLLSFWDSWVPPLKVILAFWFLPFQHFLQCALENIAAESGGSLWLVFVWVLFITIFGLIWQFIIYCWCLLLVIPCYKLYSGQGLTLNNCMTIVCSTYFKLTFGIWGR